MTDAPVTDPAEYVPPKVWTWNKESGGRFANINRPIAGPDARQGAAGRPPSAAALFAGDAERRQGHGHARGAAGAGHSGAEYDAWLIRIGDGDQFGSGFVAVNPNSKIPALMDRSGPTPIRVFESGAILLHLAEKFGAFLPTERPGARRMPVVAVLADGQRALSRRRLRPFLRLCADQDRIRHRPLRDGGEAPARRARPAAGRQRIPRGRRLHDRRHGGLAVVRRRWRRAWSTAPASSCRCRNTRTCSAGPTRSHKRPAVKRGRMVNRISGDPASQLHERHDASDFDTKTQDKIGEPAKA